MDIFSNSIKKEIEKIESNFVLINNAWPEVYIAAESINSIFDQLITADLNFDKNQEWEYSSLLMVFGSYESWIISYIMTSSGFNDIGLMSLRRSIEYACYLSKINRSNERAILWTDKGKDIKIRKSFSSIFQIPHSYFNDKYSHLNHLLVLHDYCSDYGSHGNYETLVEKFKGDNGKLVVSFQSLRNDLQNSVGFILVTGYAILKSIIITLKDNIRNYTIFDQKFDDLSSMIKKAKLELAKLEFGDNIPPSILKEISDDTNSALDIKYENLKNQYQNKI